MTIVQPALAPPRIRSHGCAGRQPDPEVRDGARAVRGQPRPAAAPLGAGGARPRVPGGARPGGRLGRAHVGRSGAQGQRRRAVPDRPRPRPAAAGAAPVRQRDRPRAAHARRLPGRRAGRARVPGLLADEPGLRQGQAHRGAREARARVRVRRRAVRRRAGGRRLRRRGAGAHPGQRRDGLQRAPRDQADDGRRGRAGRRRSRQRGQDPVHLGLDGDAQGRDQHARDAVREPAVARADLAVHEGHAAGARGLAAVEPHVRRQPQLQPHPQARRDALHRRRPARAAADPDHGEEPDGDRADDLLQRARGLRRAAAVPRARRGAAREVLRAPGPDLLRRRRAPAGPVDAARGRRPRGPRGAGDDDLLVGADGDVAAGHRGALPDRPRGRDRRARARRASSSSRPSRASSRCA